MSCEAEHCECTNNFQNKRRDEHFLKEAKKNVNSDKVYKIIRGNFTVVTVLLPE